MALTKQTIPLSFSQSANQKGDPKSLAPGTPTKVENAQFSKGNRVDKRFGYDALRLISVEGQYYEDYFFYPNNDLALDFRIFRQFDGTIAVGIQFVFPQDGSGQTFAVELDLRLDPGGTVFGFYDKSNVHWTITNLGTHNIDVTAFDAGNYTNVTFKLRDSSEDYTSVTKDGVPSTPVDFFLEFDQYLSSSDLTVFTANNPNGLEYVIPEQVENFKGLVGTEDHLLLLSDDKVYSYSDTLDKFLDIGPYRPAEITIDSTDETGRPLMTADCIHAGGITYYAFLEYFTVKDAFIYVTAIDDETGERVFGPLSLGGGDIATVRLLLFQGVPYVFYSNVANAVIGNPILGNILSPSGVGPDITLVLDMLQIFGASGGNHWNIINFNDERMVLVYPLSTSIRAIKYFDADLTQPVSPTTSTVVLVTNFQDQTSLCVSSSGDRFFVFCSLGAPTLMEYFVVDDSGTIITSPVAVGLNAGGSQANSGGIASICNPEQLDGVDGVRGYYNPGSVRYGNSADGFGKGTIRWHLANDGTLVVSSTDYQGHGYEVISKGWLNDGKWYYLLYRSAENNNCYYIGSWDDDDKLVITAQVLYGRVPDGFSPYRPIQFGSNFTEISPGVGRVSAISLDSLTALPGIISIKVDFTSKDIYSAVPYGRSMILAGTNLHAFCGQYLRELNFFFTSRNLKLTFLATLGHIPVGTFSVIAVYEFTDRNGYLHRSNPSPPQSVTTTTGTTNSIDATVESYAVSNLSGSSRLVSIIMYRTTAGGSIYYRDEYFEETNGGSDPANPGNQANNIFSDSNPVVMTRSDEELETQAVLFTVSGEIPPTPIPPVKYLTTWGSRIWAAGSARDEAIYFSKLNQTNLMPEFSELFSLAVQDKPGRTTGIAGLTDKIILSKRGRLYFSYGTGPDNLGSGGDFASFEEITGVGGVVNGKSMVVTASGVSYKSDKGIYTLSPALQTTFSGAMYEDEANEEILRAIAPIDSETIRYVMATGIISYDTYFNAWSKDSSTSLVPIDACLYKNKFHVLTADSILVENRTIWTDDSASYNMLIETGWMSLATLVGFQRFYRLFMVMDNLTPHTVTVSIAYDYGDYESSTTFTDVTDSRIIIYPTKQKCEAFRLKIEVAPNGGAEQSLNFNFIGIVVGTKVGLPKQLPVARRIGVTTI